jgi:hypothetical protein
LSDVFGIRQVAIDEIVNCVLCFSVHVYAKCRGDSFSECILKGRGFFAPSLCDLLADGQHVF